MPKKRIIFIYNPVSGGKGKKLILHQIDSLLDRRKYDDEILRTEYAGHATLLTRRAVDSGADIVCAVGGDGTVNEVARGLLHTGVALAIIPCGSGNGLARHLHIPIAPRRAIDIINKGEIHDMDYGIINDKPFFCTCGVGFDAFISGKFARSSHRGPLTYMENVLKSWLAYNPQTYTLEILDDDEKQEEKKAFIISCANASQYGNNAYIAPMASVRDGVLDVTILKPFSVLDVTQLAIQMFNGTLDQNSNIETFRCKRLVIHRDGPGLIHYDGDPVEADADVQVSIMQSGLKCLSPKEEGRYAWGENIQDFIVSQWSLFNMHGRAFFEAVRKNNKMLLTKTRLTGNKKK